MLNISIVTYNTSEAELRTVVDCAAGSVAKEIYVVDNSPRDGLREFAISLSPKINYLHGQGNVGFGAAHNMAIQKTIRQNTKYHLVLNPDVEFEPAIIKKLQDFMNDNPDVGVVMPKVLYPNGDTQYLCKLLPTPYDLLLRRFFPFMPYAKHKNEQYELQAMDYSHTHLNVPVLSGCFMLLRTETLCRTGLFDDRFFLYLEDYDLCRRVHRVAQTAFFPQASIIHSYGKGSYKNVKLLSYHICSAVKYFNKWGWFCDQERKSINNRMLTALQSGSSIILPPPPQLVDYQQVTVILLQNLLSASQRYGSARSVETRLLHRAYKRRRVPVRHRVNPASNAATSHNILLHCEFIIFNTTKL